MANVPAKVKDRFMKQIGKYQKVLQKASSNDINESDTVIIIIDILSEVFGFDKFTEITSEYAIKNTYCDLAVKLEDTPQYLIEVKSISIDLKETHLRQAVDYGAHEGIQWVILTNGIVWQGYRIVLKDTVQYEKIFDFNFLEINPRKISDIDILYLIAKEGITKDAISEYSERMQSLNRHVISGLILSELGLNFLRRELRKLTPGLKVEVEEIDTIIKNEIIKRNVLEDEKYIEAQKKIKRYLNKLAKSK